MKTRLHYIIIPLLLALAGCEKKKYPTPQPASESVFFTRLMVNGQPLEISTGKDGYYMYASYTMDSSNVYNLVGEYKKTGCSNCTNGLRVQINDAKVSSPNSSIDIGAALQPKRYDFLSGDNDLEYTVKFTGTFNKQISSVLWDFGDGSTSSELEPSHTFKTGKYQVSLTIKGNNQCQSTVVNTLSLLSGNDLNVYVSAATVSNTVSFTPYPKGGQGPYTYLWEFGDGTSSTAAAVSHTYAIKGGYGVKLKVSDAQGRTTTCYYNAVAGGDPSACAANFSMPGINYTNKRVSLSKVGIQFTDANGVVFTSDHPLQPTASDFRIISVEDFVKNEKDQPVKKVKLTFNCTLYNGSRSVSLQGSEVTIGFAYR